jgi:hypothetical protein
MELDSIAYVVVLEASRHLTGYRKIAPARFNELIMIYKTELIF